MTLAARRPSPRLNFARIPRRKFEEHCAALEEQRDRAIGQARAQRDWIASWLAGRAAAFKADADYLDRPVKPDTATIRGGALGANERRAIADELHQLLIDFEGGEQQPLDLERRGEATA